VKRALAAVDRFWRPEVPAERLALVRILVGGFALFYVVARLPHLLSYGSFAAARFEPVGIVGLLLDAPAPKSLHLALVALTAIAAVPFVLGWRFRATGPLFAALLLWTLSYRNSWGMIFHTENLLVLHVMVLALAPAAGGWSLDARRAGASAPAGRGFGWPLMLMSAITVLAYALAGIAKIRYGGDAWLAGDVLRDTIAVDNLRKIVLGSTHSPLAAPLLSQAWLFAALAIFTLVVEIGAPLALIGRRAAAVWIALVLGFHYGILALMAIGFPYPMSGIAFASMLRAERLGNWARERRRRWLTRRKLRSRVMRMLS
jgi:hypothetical protein